MNPGNILYNKSNPTVSLSDQSKSLPKGTLKKAKYDQTDEYFALLFSNS